MTPRFDRAVLCAGLVGCSAIAPAAVGGAHTSTREESHMWMTVGERRVSITLADNEAARAFAAMLPLTLDMPDLNGNEKHAKLRKALPAKDSSPGMIRAGDLMLWQGSTLVVFYLTFESPYSYTRLGRVDDPSSIRELVGEGMIRIAFTRD